MDSSILARLRVKEGANNLNCMARVGIHPYGRVQTGCQGSDQKYILFSADQTGL